MKMQKKAKKVVTAAAFVAVISICGGLARGSVAAVRALFSTARPEVSVTMTGSVARAGDELPLEKAGAVTPGEVLTWRMRSQNGGDGAARTYSVVGQIPRGTIYVAGSATAQGRTAAVTYSIDGGATYSALPTIERKREDGTTERVPAPVSAYTQVRFELPGELEARGALVTTYRVRVNK